MDRARRAVSETGLGVSIGLLFAEKLLPKVLLVSWFFQEGVDEVACRAGIAVGESVALVAQAMKSLEASQTIECL